MDGTTATSAIAVELPKLFGGQKAIEDNASVIVRSALETYHVAALTDYVQSRVVKV